MDSINFQCGAARVLATTHNLIQRFGARLAGSQACLKTAQALQQELQEICGSARLESFSAHPGAFMGYFKINVLVYITGAILLNLRLPFPAALCFLFIIVSGFLEFGFYKEFFDPLFPKKTCNNLLAALQPQGEPLRQLIISGHHDSAQELTWMRKDQKLYALKVVIPDIFYMTALLFSWCWVFWLWFANHPPAFSLLGTWFLSLGILLVLPKYFIVSRRGSPGAGDNLVASAMLVELARGLAASDSPGKSSLQHTRLLFISFDAEEAGLRGARAFAAAHCDDLQALPAYMLNIDSIYNVREIQFLISDLNDTISLSREMAERCACISGAAGYPQKFLRMVFGGGGTDAAELARIGVQATTLIAMPTGLIRDGLVYHTLNDTVDAIEPAAVEACLRIAHTLALELDNLLLV
jgi:aminopeptidase YwaD